MKRLRLLIIDDDELVRDSFKMSVPDTWEVLASTRDIPTDREILHAAFVDMHLTDNLEKQEGLGVIEILNHAHPHLEIVAMSGDLNRELMEKSLKMGASRFIAKPLSREEIILILDKIESLWQLRGVGGQESASHFYWVGVGQETERVKRFISQMRGEKSPILIEGESGTGKEVVSQLIHLQDTTRPFVAVNVAAIPENLFESEFFGHVKGAFTGAVNNRVGFAELAHGGDLFLDEIETLSKPHQAKLLRFLETGEYNRVGEKDMRVAKVRVIAATNENLNDLVSEGKFREDLLFRLSGHQITLPPLRDRLEDIPSLCKFFLEQYRSFSKKEFSPESMVALKAYSWPGNVRELKRVCEQLAVMSPLPIIRDEDVNKLIYTQRGVVASKDFDISRGLGALVSDYEKLVLEHALDKNDDVEELAKTLKISRSSFYKKIKDHGIELKK